MNKGQAALQKKMDAMIEEVGKPLTYPQYKILLDALRKVSPDSLWGFAIHKAMEGDRDVTKLVEGLASQAVDDPMTMVAIVGQNATIYLLRLASYDMTIDEMVQELKTNPKYEQKANV